MQNRKTESVSVILIRDLNHSSCFENKTKQGAGWAYSVIKDQDLIDLLYIVRRPVPVYVIIAGEGP